MSDDPYHKPLTRALKAEDAYEEDPALAALRKDYPGITVQKRAWESASAGGGVNYIAVWQGQVVSALSVGGLREALGALESPGGPGGPRATA